MSDDLHIEVTDGVILDVTARALGNIEGIHSLSKRFFDTVVDGITTRFGQKSWPGMNVKHKVDEKGEDFIEVNVYIRAIYGYHLLDLCHTIQQQLRQDLRNMLSLERVRVDVHVEELEPLEQEEGSNRNDHEE